MVAVLAVFSVLNQLNRRPEGTPQGDMVYLMLSAGSALISVCFSVTSIAGAVFA